MKNKNTNDDLDDQKVMTQTESDAFVKVLIGIGLFVSIVVAAMMVPPTDPVGLPNNVNTAVAIDKVKHNPEGHDSRVDQLEAEDAKASEAVVAPVPVTFRSVVGNDTDNIKPVVNPSNDFLWVMLGKISVFLVTLLVILLVAMVLIRMIWHNLSYHYPIFRR